MKFWEIFSFEMGYQLRRPSNWIFTTVVIALSSIYTFSLMEDVLEGNFFLNSPLVVSGITVMACLFILLLTANLTGNAAVRDLQVRMEPILYSTSLKKLEYLGGRFLAVLLINAIVLLIFIMGLFIASQVPAWENLFISNKFATYFTALAFFAVPNTIITTGILFALSIWTKKAMAPFIGAVLLFFISLVSMDIIAGILGMWDLGKKLDLTGFTILRELQFSQSPLMLKAASVEPDYYLFLNRLLWLFISFALIAFAYLNFSFTIKTGKKTSLSEKKVVPSVAQNGIWSNGLSIPSPPRNFNFKSRIEQIIYLAWNCFRNLITGKVWLIYPALAMIMVIASREVLEGQLGVPMIATSWRVIEFLKSMGADLILALLSTYYAGYLVWKERDARVNEISDASPVRDSVLYISKFIGLVILLLFLQVLVMCTGFIVQVWLDAPSIDLLLYLKVLFGLRLIDLLLFALVAFLVHVVVNQKYVGHLIVFLAFIYMFFPGLIKLDHNLLIFGSAPDWYYYEISGFGPSIRSWLYFKLYWISWAILLALVSRLFWVRGKEQEMSKRFNQAKINFSGTPAKIGVPVLLVVFILGGYIFYNTNILNSYISATEQTELQAEYEKKYEQYQFVPQPILSEVKLQVELYPTKQEAEIKGQYRLVNKSLDAIDSIHITTTSYIRPEEITFSEETSVVSIDEDMGHRIYTLKNSLLPGDTLNMQFLARYQQTGFDNYGRNRDVIENGTYIGFHLLPAIGYAEHRELNNKADREKYGLSPQPKMPSLYDLGRRMDVSGAEKIHFEAILGTSRDQTAITAGRLKRSWLKNNRRYYEYVTDVPITHNYEIFSAEYELHEAKWQDVDIQIFHHPEHTRNLERMVNGIQKSLEYFSENFNPYPHSQIRLVEFPGSGVSLNGNPVTMSYTEDFSFFAPEKDLRELDFPFAVIGHEVAHQWWGNELRPAYVEGAPILTESLAWYSSWMLVENTFGKEHLERLLKVMRQAYLSPKSPADVPLLRANDQFNSYRKGPFVMYTIQEYIGETKVNLALKRLLEKFDSREPPLPVTLDLYTELQKVTPDSLQYLLEDLFKRNTLWELKANEATATPLEGGMWNLTFHLDAKKLAVDKEGIVTDLPMNDYVDLAVYSNSQQGGQEELLYLERHRLSSGEQTFNIKVSQKPELVHIDPNELLIDRKPDNNLSIVEIQD